MIQFQGGQHTRKACKMPWDLENLEKIGNFDKTWKNIKIYIPG